MLSDLITFLTTHCSPHIRGMGYLEEAMAMRKRYRQRGSAWRPHLENTRRFVIEAAEKCRRRNRVVVLGSGLLLDVPLFELTSLFREVVLMDVICLPEAGKKIRSFPNARFIEHDATGLAGTLYRNKLARIHSLPEVTAVPYAPYEGADLVVSLNILSQLWVIPRSTFVKSGPRVGPDELDEWCGRIVEAHWASLRSMPCPVCLIADHEFVRRDPAGAVISSGSTVYDLALPEPEALWTWDIMPLGAESTFYSKELTVGAWHMLPLSAGIVPSSRGPG